jgi:DNA-binding IclR family transcriptional regulator
LIIYSTYLILGISLYYERRVYNMKSNDVVQSVDRALSILEALSDGEMGLIDLSKKVELNKSTVHRLLNTLIYKNYVSQNPENNKYRLTFKVLELGNKMLNTISIVSIAKPYITRLAEETNEVVHLVSIEGNEVVYIDKIDSNNTIRMHSYIGKSIPIYCTAVGKAYMASMDDEMFFETWKNIEKNIVKLTDNTITTKEAMLEELKRIRDAGYSIDREENEEDVVCVAAPIFNFDKKVKYAISISTPKIRINDEKIKLFGRLVKDTADKISKELGYFK